MEKAPVFVKIKEQDDIIDILNLAREKLIQAKSLLLDIDGAKDREDRVMNEWRAELHNVEMKVEGLKSGLPEV